MRAQPFHFGHQNYILTLSKRCDRGVVILCRDSDDNNPFSLEVRTRWINDFLGTRNISNIVVAKRPSITVSRKIEYNVVFDGEDFLVVTTDQTDDLYKRLGFCTLNHHDPRNNFWNHLDKRPVLDGLGTIIRNRLKRSLSCSQYLDEKVENEARKIITEKI